ncbi:MAG TPA: hypothetical protein VGJ07_31700, partial [Rugosimonospora sp.]
IADLPAADSTTAEPATTDLPDAEPETADLLAAEPETAGPETADLLAGEPATVEPETADLLAAEPETADLLAAELTATELTATELTPAGPAAVGPAFAAIEPPVTRPRLARNRPAAVRRPYVRVTPPIAESIRTLMIVVLGGLIVVLIVAVLVGIGLRPAGLTAGTAPSPVPHPVHGLPKASTSSPSPAATLSASASVPPLSSPPPSAPVTAAGTVLPAGWYMFHDPTGFSVAVPDGWTLSHSGSIVYFHDPSGGRLLGIDQTNQPKSNPVADWTTQAQYRVAHGDFPGYQQIKIAAVPYHVAAADWEFTYNKDGVRTHVINRGAVFGPHQAYGFYWSTPDSSWTQNLPNFNLIMSTFQGRT